MIFLSGDIHGLKHIDKVVDYFKVKSKEMELTKSDYLIILGDVAVCWDGGEHDRQVRELLQSLPVTTLFIDGNHENFPLIYKNPRKSWKGGKVHIIAPDILHLMRGYVFEIEGKKIFTFGGGHSIDKIFRKEGKNWFPEEAPSKREYARGWRRLRKARYSVDHILTHTAPIEIVKRMGFNKPTRFSGGEELMNFLQEVIEKTEFKSYYFGHFHKDIEFDNKFFGLMDEIVIL